MHKVETKILDGRLNGVEYATAGAAAVDLRACSIDGTPIMSPVTIAAGQRIKVGTGVAIHLDSPEIAAFILPRSGLGSKDGIVLGNLVGLIDSDYQGELLLSIWNTGANAFVIEPLMRLAQMGIVPVLRPKFVVVQEFSTETARGTGGFGSTGHQ